MKKNLKQTLRLAALGSAAALLLASTSLQAANGAANRGYETHLRTAYEAYASGDYESAMYDYERILGLTNDPRVQVRVLISLAMIRLLPSSKMRDAEAAQMVLDEIDRRVKRHQLEYEFFGELELLSQLGKQEQQIRQLRLEQRGLKKDLEQRDEVIRQLRALTVESGE